ncbi:uncharacterized protein LOC130893304 [Diorhabda carinulata]|uniref:uncharacterized protein LOC130893304 n=1 Tax=Diorhabda carinulata TaxID=1163345 RepID=UPI0025A15377|nr:uncharacterized protein LOC130893304 [Diorhabda carinulata]
MIFFAQCFLIFLSTVTAKDKYVFPYRNKIGFCKQTSNYNNILENPWYLFLLIILGIIFVLMFLGLIKGLIGICCSRFIGEMGLSILIDLPKPLDKYSEKEYRNFQVKYDSEGWPVDPNTRERTVRALPKKTEFSLNLIFFLAYPLAICLHICGACCCVKDIDEIGTEHSCYNSINIVSMKRKNGYYRCGQNLDIYQDNDKKEEEDTHYVINQMRRSQISLQNDI